MDFHVVDNLVSLNSATAASNNGGSLASETDADASTLRLYGSAFLSRECAAAEDDDGLPAAKAAKISSCGGEMAKVSSQEWSNGGGLTPPHQQMLSFSAHHAPPLAFPSVRTSSGYGCGVRGPFTPSQWMELEHQALIYKYITANVPIPSSLLIPIRKAFESSGFSCFSLLRSNALGWGGFHMGFSKNDPEPGRCRRTDGKKWRCSRDAVADQKYCERHINRGRHRSRKPVEGGTTATSSNANASSPASLSHHHQQTNNLTSGNSCPKEKENAAAPKMCFKESEFGSVASDSLLNPFTRSPSHALRHFIDEWPKGHSDLSSCAASPTNEKLADRDFEETQMGLGVGAVASEQSQRHSSWDPISWEPSVGGPLGEALHSKALDLMETRLPSSPLGVHRGAFVGVAPEQRAARRSTGIAFATASSAPVSCFHHYLHSES